MCFPSPSDQLKFKFKPLGTTVPLFVPEVKGFEASVDPTQDDADAAAAALEALYNGLPQGQQAVLAQIVLQATQAV
jgi:hypothetical protein